MVAKIDSNKTGLAIAEETSPKVLPGSPVWYAQEPNSYNDFGGQITTVAREPISSTRQRKKGSTTDLDASGGYNTDLTQNNMTRLLQGFLFADAHEKADTAALNEAGITITAVDGTNDQYEAASGLTVFAVGDIILASGFGIPANNGIKVLDAVAAGAVDAVENLIAEASPPAAARIQTIGHQFASDDLTLTVASGVATLATTTANLNDKGLQVGEWIFIGGDAAGLKFATAGVSYGRIASIAAKAIVLDKVTNSGLVTDAGASKTIQIFYGKFIRNEATDELIVTRTYNVERTLGNNGTGVQAEYLEGAVANELTLNIPAADKASIDLSFAAMNNAFTTGAEGVKSGTRVAALSEQAFNTSSNVYRTKLNIIDPVTLVPTPLFGYVNEASVAINNNASLVKAVGTLGGIDISVGNFEVGGSVTALFTDVAAVQAVRDNADVTYDIILAKSNAGMVYDIPLLALGNGRINVTKDQPITVPLDTLAAESAAGYTLGITNFPYLPTAAMPA